MNPDQFQEHKPDRPVKGRDKSVRRKRVKRSRAQEDRLAGKLGGERVAGSGSGRAPTRAGRTSKARVGPKGDVDVGPLLVEAKRTDKASISVKRKDVVKISRVAAAVGKSPALAIEFLSAEARASVFSPHRCDIGRSEVHRVVEHRRTSNHAIVALG